MLMFVVSHVSSCLYLSQKWLLMRFILPVVLKRTIRFLTIVDITLGKHNNYQPNNKLLGVKYVSIVLEQNYFNGALLMIR